MGPKDVGPKAGWLRPGAHKTATPSLIAAPTFICMSRLQFAGASVIKNAARSRDPSSSFVCSFDKWVLPPVTCSAEQWSRIGVYPVLMTRLKSLIGVVSSSMSGHLHHHSLHLTFDPLSQCFLLKDKIH